MAGVWGTADVTIPRTLRSVSRSISPASWIDRTPTAKRNHTLRLTVLTLILLSLVQQLPGQKTCYKCKGTGKLACKSKEHDPKRVCGKWTFEHRCTPIFQAPCCRGTGMTTCSRCNDPVAEAELGQDMEARVRWAKSQREFLSKARLKGVTVETKNFTLHCMVRRWSTKAGRHNRSRTAHLFAYRLQQLADRFEELCGQMPSQRQTLVLCDSGAENVSFTLNHMQGGYQIPLNRYTMAGLSCTWPIPQAPWHLKDDKNMHAHVIHRCTHLLHWANIKFHMQTTVWLDVGLAHWMSQDLTGLTRDFCFNEGTARAVWKEADWKKKILKEVSGKDEVKFATLLSRKNIEQTSHREHAYCWSFVDFLIHAHPEKFKQLYKQLKATNDTKKALDSTFNLSSASFHDQWRKWVLKNYAPR